MHEMSIAQSICETVRANLPAGARPTRVTVICGALSGVVPEALDACFPFAAEAAGFAGLEIELELPEASAACPACGHAFLADNMWADCPRCGHAPVTFEGGRELRVKEFDIE